jgi:hypothetical protein
MVGRHGESAGRHRATASAQPSPRDAGVVELGLHVPRTEPELQAAVGQQVGRGGLANQQRGIQEARVQHVCAQPDPPGDHACRDKPSKRRRDPEVIGCGEKIEAEPLGAVGGGSELGPRAARQVPDAESHVGFAAISCRRPASRAGRENIAQCPVGSS